MKKIIRRMLLPVFALLLGVFWTGGAKEVQAAEPVIEIKTADDLAYNAGVGGGANTYEGVTFVLMNDIDMKELSEKYQGQVIRFGSKDAPFAGTFDGNGHTISNLKNEKSVLPDTDLGLFAWTGNGAVIKDLTLKDPVVDCAYRGGILVGNAQDTTIENIRIHGGKLKIQPANNVVSLITNVGFAGGAIAGSIDHTTLYNCEVRGTEVVNNSTQGVAALGGEGLYMGGIVGSATGGSVIEYCRVDDGLQINESGDYEMVETTVRNEYDVAVGALGGKAVYAGGIAGELRDGSRIIDSYSTADVYVYCATYVSVGAGNVAYAGGVVAEMYGGNCEVIRSHYAGNIHTKQYNALLVIPIIEYDKYISGVAQHSESEKENNGLTNSYFQRSASETDKDFRAFNDNADTDSCRGLTDDQYRNRSFWIGKGYDLYGTIERTDGATTESHYNKWVMDYKRGIPIHGNAVSAAIDFPGAGEVTISGTDLIKHSLEGYPANTDCSVSTDDAYHFAIQGYDTYEDIELSTEANTVQDQTGAEHPDAFKFIGWYQKRDNFQDSVMNIRQEYADFTDNYANRNCVGTGNKYTTTADETTGLKDNDLYVAHYQANVVFHDVDGNVIDKKTGQSEGALPDLTDDYYNYQDLIPEVKPSVPEGCTFYGWTDKPYTGNGEKEGYEGITNPDLTTLITGGNIYQAGDLIEKPMQLYPIFTSYKTNVITIMEGNDRTNTYKRADVGITSVNVDPDTNELYIEVTGLNGKEDTGKFYDETGDPVLPDGYRFLGWYEDGHRISKDMRFSLDGVDLSLKHTYTARLEYRVEYWVHSEEVNNNIPADEDGWYKYGEFWQEYNSAFNDIAVQLSYKEYVEWWGTAKEGGIPCKGETKITDKLTVYGQNADTDLTGEYQISLLSDFPGAGTLDQKGGAWYGGGYKVSATAGEGYNFKGWGYEEYRVIGSYYDEQTWLSDNPHSFSTTEQVRHFYFEAHFTANVSFKWGDDTGESMAAERAYHQQVLTPDPLSGTYTSPITETELTDSGAAWSRTAAPAAETVEKEGYEFLGWIDKSAITQDEINYVFDIDEYTTSRASKAIPYLVDGDDLVERPMDLYAVYVKEDITTTTNIREAGVPDNAGINIPSDPYYTVSDQENGLKTLTLTAENNKTSVVNDQDAKYVLQYVEMITNPGTAGEKTERLELSDGKQGDDESYIFEISDFDLGPAYKFIAYYEPLAVVYHLNDSEIQVEVRNTGQLLGESPDPKYVEADIDAAAGGSEMYSFIGWTTAKPEGTYHNYYLLNNYADKDNIYLAKPEDRVRGSMELFPVYAPVNVTVSSTIDAQLSDDEKTAARWIDRNESGDFVIHAVPTKQVGDTNYVFTGWKVKTTADGEKDFSNAEKVTLAEVFDGAEYIAQYSRGYTVNYHYWDENGDAQILYSVGVTEGDERSFVTTIENEKPDGTTEEIKAPVDTEAFTGIMGTLAAGQYFDEWQWVKSVGEVVSWDDFCATEITQDMDLYPVIWQAKVYDSSDLATGKELSQTSDGTSGPEVYVQADLTKADVDQGGKQTVSVYFAGVYTEESLRVNVSRQNYKSSGQFAGVEGITADIYNEYRLEEVENPEYDEEDPASPPTITEMTGDFMASGETDEKGNALFEFNGKLTISKEMADGLTSDEPFIFTVAQQNEDGTTTETKLVVPAGGSVTMKLPFGKYTVSEDSAWAWRYTSVFTADTHDPDGEEGTEAAQGSTVYINSYESNVTCTNSIKNNKWFDGGTNVKNVFRGTAGDSGAGTGNEE